MDEAARWRAQVADLERTLAQERRKLQILRELGVALGSTLDLEELSSLVCTRVCQALEARHCLLYLLDEEAKALVVQAGQRERGRAAAVPMGQGAVGKAALSGATIRVERGARSHAMPGCERDPEPDTTLCVPMKNHHGRTLGVLQVIHKRQGSFDAQDEALLAALIGQISVAIENSQLFLSVVDRNMELLATQERLERKLRELDVLVDISRVAAAAGELDDLLHGVLVRTMRAMEARAGAIWLANDRKDELRRRCALASGPGDTIISMQDMTTQVPAETDPELRVPMPLEQGIGSIELRGKLGSRGQFGDDDRKLCTVIAGHLAAAINLARARERRQRQQRLSAIGQLLSGVMHDLRTPMTIISGYARHLAQEPDPERRRALSQNVSKQIKRMEHMIRDLLAFARGNTRLWLRKVYLAPFFESLLQQLTLELEAFPVEVTLRLHDRGTAYFDAEKMQRLAHNLARNAAEAMQASGGQFLVEVSRRAPDGALTLSFTDTGPGIPEAVRERLFESFTSHGKPGGSGLGLAIVHRIVKDHAGTIDVQSRNGHTCFVVSLPQPSHGEGKDDATRSAEQGAQDSP